MNNIGPVPQIDTLTDMTCKLTSSSSTCYSKLRPKDQNQCKISIMKQNKHYTYGSKLEQSIKHSNIWYTLQIQFTKSVKHSFRFRNNKLFQPRAQSMVQQEYVHFNPQFVIKLHKNMSHKLHKILMPQFKYMLRQELVA